MYLRRVDEIEHLNGNRAFANTTLCIVCSAACIGKNKKSLSYMDYYHYYYCPICGALYHKVFNGSKGLLRGHITITFQICFDDDNPELEIIQRYLNTGDNSKVFAVDHEARCAYENGKLSYFADGSLRIITTNEKDVFEYGNDRVVLTPEEVIFGKD